MTDMTDMIQSACYMQSCNLHDWSLLCMLSLTSVDNPADVAETHMVHGVLLQ